MSRAPVHAFPQLCLALALGLAGGRAGAVTFPLQPSANGRYLVEQGGAPFFMVGDSAQSADCALTLAEFQSYVDTRVGQGFNTINVNFIDHRYCENPPADRSGNLPFTTALGGGAYTSLGQDPDFTTPNDVYFAGLEQKIAYAQSKGVLVSLAFYMGPGSQDCFHHSEGWYGELCQNSSAAATSLGTYLAIGHGAFGGFKKYPNVIWVWGADLKFTTDTATRDKLHAVPAAMKAAGSTQLMSGDWNVGLATDQGGFQTYMDLEAVYAYSNNGPIVGQSRAGYAYVPSTAAGDGRALPALPAFMKETGYEGEGNPSGTPSAVRGFGWSSILNGCTAGYWYGHRDVWDFARPSQGYTPCLFPGCTDWTTSINSTGAQDMARLSALLGTLAWQKLVPSGTAAPFIGRTLVPGNDTATGGAISAAQASDGTLLLAYVPSVGVGSQSFTVDTRSLAGTATARWWDPTSGAFTAAGTLSNTATHGVTTPGNNTAADNDWLLVLDTGGVTGVSISPPGATVPPRGGTSFTASGGSGTGYTWSLAVNASGGTIDAGGGYTAGSTGGVSDTVKVTDSLGNFATARVTVTAGVTITPAAPSVAPGASVSFSASGGSGTGYTWSLSTNASGGSIGPTGAYTAGTTSNVVDTVKVVDSLGNVAFAAVTVALTPVVSISPSSASVPPRGKQTFTASGGSGTGYVWSLATNASGGSITAAGAYTAGSAGNVTDTVKVADSLGNIATAPVTVGAGVSIAPSTASVAPGGTASFSASGGSGTGFVWTLAVNASGGSIGPSGLYTAGAKENVTDTLKATDSLGNFATASVAVSTLPPVTISPAGASVVPEGTVAFTASGGSNTGWAWSIAVNGSGGSIDAAGVYTAGQKGDTTDTVRVTDSLGHAATAVVNVSSHAGGVVKGGCSSSGAGVEWVLALLAAAAGPLRRRRT